MTDANRKLGRNDPCWCGSGKLYKHCHRREDVAKEKQAKREARTARRQEEAMQAAQQAAEKARLDRGQPEPFEAPPPLPEVAAARARWERFEATNLEAKIAIFQATLDSGEMDAEEAFEMTENIRRGLDSRRNAEDRARYGELIEQLFDTAPDLYHQNAPYYASNLVDDAIAGKRWEVLPDLMTAYAQKPEIDRFLNVMADQLMYHNQMRLLKEAMAQMWPAISSSDEIMPWGVGEFASQLLLVILLDYLETAESPRADDPELREATAAYGEYDAEWVEKAIEHLRAASPVSWQPADFDETVDAEQWSLNLQGLLFDFMADQHRHAALPYSRSYILTQELGSFLEQQLTAPSSPAGRRQSRKRRSKRKRRRAVSPVQSSSLVPRRTQLDRFLAGHLQFLGARPYRVGCVTELLPAYLHFLARVGAIHPTEIDAGLQELHPLAAHVIRALESHRADPHLLWAVDQAWSAETLAALRDDPMLAEARSKPAVAAPPPSEPERKPGALQTFTFKVTYLRDPEVWLMLEIAEHQTLDDLHYAVQRAVDFDADHLYSFFMSNRAWDRSSEYASPHADGSSAAQIPVGNLRLRMKQRFLYLFDYGDEHRFEVQLVATNPDAPQDRYPKVVESHGEAPSQYGWWDDEGDGDDQEDWD
jgi:hypothetical protein